MAKKNQKKSEETKDENLAHDTQPIQETISPGTGNTEPPQDEPAIEESASRQDVRRGPDPAKDTLMIQYKDGRLQVLSTIGVKNDGTIEFNTVDASLKNHPAFYEIRNSRELSAKIMQYNRTFKDWKTDVPKYYKVPYSAVPQVAMALSTLTQDPKNFEALEIQRKYSTNSFALEKIIFDQPLLPIEVLAQAGFDVAEMKATGAFKQMENGQFTKNLYTRREEINGLKIEGAYALRAVHDEAGGIKFEALTPQSQESLKNDPLMTKLDEKTRTETLGGKTLPYPVMHDGQLCFAGVNRTLNRMVYVPCADYPAPSSIYGVTVDAAQRQALGRGERVLFRNCSTKEDDPDNHYEGYGQFDMVKMEYSIADKIYERPHLPKAILDQLNAQQRETVFEKNGYINGANIRTKNGDNLLWMIGINPVTNNIQYVSYPRYELAALEAQKKDLSVKDVLNKISRQQSEEHVPDISVKNKNGQRM